MQLVVMSNICFYYGGGVDVGIQHLFFYREGYAIGGDVQYFVFTIEGGGEVQM